MLELACRFTPVGWWDASLPVRSHEPVRAVDRDSESSSCHGSAWSPPPCPRRGTSLRVHEGFFPPVNGVNLMSSYSTPTIWAVATHVRPVAWLAIVHAQWLYS